MNFCKVYVSKNVNTHKLFFRSTYPKADLFSSRPKLDYDSSHDLLVCKAVIDVEYHFQGEESGTQHSLLLVSQPAHSHSRAHENTDVAQKLAIVRTSA
jgi:hypothetical protein